MDEDFTKDERLKEFLLEAFPNPKRVGCPDEKTLQAAAEERLASEHPARRHVASCSECYGEYLNYREDWIESKPTPIPNAVLAFSPSVRIVPAEKTPAPTRNILLPFILAACGLAGFGGLLAYKLYKIPPSVASNAPESAVPATVDLYNAVTVRGVGEGTEDDPGSGSNSAAPLNQVFLPSKVVSLSIVLPRFSQVGAYEVLVAKDHAGAQVVAKGRGTATQVEGKVIMRAELDLRAAKPGSYFLATVRGSDNGTYYYPLQVR